MRHLGKGLVLLAVISYPVLLHMFILKGELDWWRMLLVLLPLLLWALWMAARWVGAKWLPLLAASLAALVYYLAAGQHLRYGLIAFDGVSHASMNLFMLWFFGRTLPQGREPLVSQISRHLNGGALPPEIAGYTRAVTIAWSLFFAAQLLGSALLYLFAPLAAWSLFVNVLNAPLLGLMFIGEYIIRVLLHPDHARNSILQVIEVFTKNFAVTRKPE